MMVGVDLTVSCLYVVQFLVWKKSAKWEIARRGGLRDMTDLATNYFRSLAIIQLLIG